MNMHETIDAIYENGVFKALAPVKGLKDGGKVTITVTKASKRRPFKVPETLTEGSADEMIRTIEERFFTFAHTAPSTVPVRKLEDLMGGWPKEERDDGFDKAFKKWRKKNIVRNRR
jgi:predicted DNA-binding antitoxin AbrB/MazE fold protein